jgi:hypothetical protein
MQSQCDLWTARQSAKDRSRIQSMRAQAASITVPISARFETGPAHLCRPLTCIEFSSSVGQACFSKVTIAPHKTAISCCLTVCTKLGTPSGGVGMDCVFGDHACGEDQSGGDLLVGLSAFEFQTHGNFVFAHAESWGGHRGPAKEMNADPSKKCNSSASSRRCCRPPCRSRSRNQRSRSTGVTRQDAPEYPSRDFAPWVFTMCALFFMPMNSFHFLLNWTFLHSSNRQCKVVKPEGHLDTTDS